MLPQLRLGFNPWPRNFLCCGYSHKKKKKKKKKSIKLAGKLQVFPVANIWLSFGTQKDKKMFVFFNVIYKIICSDSSTTISFNLLKCVDFVSS